MTAASSCLLLGVRSSICIDRDTLPRSVCFQMNSQMEASRLLGLQLVARCSKKLWKYQVLQMHVVVLDHAQETTKGFDAGRCARNTQALG